MRRTKECAEGTREAILDAAERVFTEQGVAATSLSQIARAAGLTRGAIYWHFCGKVDLFKAMQDRARLPQERFFSADALLKETGPVLPRLRSCSLDILDFIARDERSKRVYAILLFRCEYVGEMEEVLLRKRQADDQMRVLFEQTFTKAASQGELGVEWDPMIAARVYFCALSGLISEWLRTENAFELPLCGRAMVDSLFASFTRSDIHARPVLRALEPERPLPEPVLR